jgi:hypothetical protein
VKIDPYHWKRLTSGIRWNALTAWSVGNRLPTNPNNPFHGDQLKGVIMTSLDEVDRKLSQVLKEIQTIQVDLKSVKRAVNESHAADVGMASMTAEDIDMKLNKILELLVQS